MSTILQSFAQALPVGGNRHQDPDPKATQSGTTTQNSSAPKTAIRVPYETGWAPFAKKVLDNTNVQMVLSRSYIGTWERSRCLRTEGDVVAASAVHLIHPVDQVLSAIRHHRGVEILSLNGETHEKVRADKTWMYRSRSGKETHFAVLDFKKVGIIREQEFQNASSEINSLRSLRSELDGLDEEETYFVGNSEIIVKQAVCYSAKYTTPYVALFDWDHLVLFYFGSRNVYKGGDYCFMTVVSDRGRMRHALLAFLARAYESTIKGEENLPAFKVLHDTSDSDEEDSSDVSD